MACTPVTCSGCEVDLGTFAAESTDRIRLTITKDDVAWTGIDSVVFRFTPPSGTEFDRDGVNETPDEGVWYYDTTTTDLTEAGDWSLSVQATDGSVVKWYPHNILFTVTDRG
jgi:hypothetical protein